MEAYSDHLQDEMLKEAMEMEHVEAEAEECPKPKRWDFLNHKDWRQELKSREKRRMEMDKHQQTAHDQTWRWNLKVERPSWCSIVKPILPKILRSDEYKQGSHLAFSNHGGDRTIREILKILKMKGQIFHVRAENTFKIKQWKGLEMVQNVIYLRKG